MLRHTARRKKNMSQFERFVTEGKEKADELAKAGAMLDEGFTTEASSETVQQERVEVHAALQCAASFHCLVEQWKDCEELKPKPKEKWIFVDEKSEETKRRAEWCAEADKCRCMRCGSTFIKMSGKCTGPKFLSKSLEKWGRRHLGGHDLVRRMDTQGEVLIWRRKCSGFARQRMGPKLMICCKPELMGTQGYGKMLKIIQVLEDGRVPAEEGRNWRVEESQQKSIRGF